jgi:hypothetical protein
MLIYTIEKADKTRDSTRNVTINFFKDVLGFKDENIFFIDRNEFIETDGQESTKFSTETQEALNKFAIDVF